LSFDAFLRLVAEREGVPPDKAREHTAAVFATLREAVPKKEFSDIVSQLPKEFESILPRL
jgi:uncharacterized protein (DUF2267 family)